MSLERPGDNMARPGLSRRDFRVMNSDVSLICGGTNPDRRLRRAEIWVLAYEARFSRFRESSELSRLNQMAGRPFRASPALFSLVKMAVDLANRSGGLFDPTMLGALEHAGYDRSFELLAANRQVQSGAPPRASFQQVGLDQSAREISLPAGVGLDLGGIGKGWAVDRLAKILGVPCLVNAGGDVFAAGVPGDGEKWRVGVANPFSAEEDLLMLSVRDRGVATSSSLTRRWQAGGAMLHHLIDPRTGEPSTSDAVQVTVVAPSATEADYHAKLTLLLGAEQGRAYLDREPTVEGLIVRADSSESRSSGLGQFL